jgi:hypothetical protein
VGPNQLSKNQAQDSSSAFLAFLPMLTSTATPVAFAGTAFPADTPVAGLPSGAPPVAQRPEPRLPTPAAWPFLVAAGRHAVDLG